MTPKTFLRIVLALCILFLLLPGAPASAQETAYVFLPVAATPPLRAVSVSAGGWHTCALTSQYGVQCWGADTDGQLGHGPIGDQSQPIDVTGMESGVAMLSAGKQHNCVVTNKGAAYCWGQNEDGRLGDGTTILRNVPTLVVGLDSGVKSIIAGNYHSCAIMNSGQIKCWGRNAEGQLGDGTKVDRLTPVDVIGYEGHAVEVVAAWYYTCAISDAGHMSCWGLGALGNGGYGQQSAPTLVHGLDPVKSATAGAAHTCVLTVAGEISCWGINDHGQVGNNTNAYTYLPMKVEGLPIMREVRAGAYHTCAIASNSFLYCWGDNSDGGLGDGTTTERWLPVKAIGLPTPATTIGTSGNFVCAVTQSTDLYCWGAGWSGQLGDGFRERRLQPVPVIGLSSE